MALGVAAWAASQELAEESSKGRQAKSELDAADQPGEASLQELLDQGQALLEAGRMREAIEAYDAAILRSLETGEARLQAEALTSLGLVYKRLGDYHLAVTLYLRARDLCRGLGDAYCQAEALHNLGTCYTELGEWRIARDTLEEALETWPTTYETGATMTALASLDDLEGEHETALERYRRAFVIRHGARDVEDAIRRRGKAVTLDRQATAFKQMGLLARARRGYETALGLFEIDSSEQDVALTSANLGWLHVDLQQPAIALEYLGRALELFEKTERAPGQAHALVGTAHAYRQLDDLAMSLEVLERAIDLVERLRSSSLSHQLRVSFLSRRQSYYELYVDVLMQRHAKDPGAGYAARALHAAERFKSRSLLDLLNEELEALLRMADRDQSAHLQRLHQRMNAKDHQRLELLHRKAPREAIAAVERELRDLILRNGHLVAELRSELPDASAPEPLSPGRMQALLDHETVLLVYALGTERSFLWRVDRESVEPHVLPGRDEIEHEAEMASAWFRNSDQRGSAPSGKQAVWKLSETLLGQVRQALVGKRLVVVGDGLLNTLPFAALLSSPGRPMVLDHEIVMVPSVSVLAALRARGQERAPAPNRLAVLADPVFGIEDPRVDLAPGAVDRAVELAIPPPERLEGSAREAEAILALVPAHQRRSALGFDASRELVLSGDLARYQIVHFAVHGELDDEQPELSHLLLSLAGRRGERRDGRIYLHEIDDLHLPADLVVLSACNTALGKQVQGEGLLGMTRGFMKAGASRLVVSLWNVDDAATAELMERFYRALLAEARPPAAALRAAQVQMRQSPRWRAPYFWAGFVLQGEWR